MVHLGNRKKASVVKCCEQGSQTGLRLAGWGFPPSWKGRRRGGGLSRGAILFASRFNVKPLASEEVDKRGSRVTLSEAQCFPI